jgi:hypothetical protein
VKKQRPGLILGTYGETITIGLDPQISPTHLKLLDSDIVITVNEVTALGSIRLGIHTPSLFFVRKASQPSVPDSSQNHLRLTRPVGTSIVIRKQDHVLDRHALNDLRLGGIHLSNCTQALSTAGKTGASIAFHANEDIWKIVRLELTLLRGITK